MSKSYYRPSVGEWIQPRRRGYKLACCDCALVHKLDFRIHKGRVQFRVFRHNRATAGMRRGLTIAIKGRGEVVVIRGNKTGKRKLRK